MLTPFWGAMGSVSVAKAVVASAGAAGRALVVGDVTVARALAQNGFDVVLSTVSTRVRARPELFVMLSHPAALPIARGGVQALVFAGRGVELRGAAEDATQAAANIERWMEPLEPGGRLVLVDRIDGGILGARPTASAQDLCAALLAARLREIAQVLPKAGTVITCGVRTGGGAAASAGLSDPASAPVAAALRSEGG